MFIRTVQKEALKMAKIGYGRVSSREQHLDRKLAALKGVDKLFTDKLSGANTNRPELQKMLAYIREGDIVGPSTFGMEILSNTKNSRPNKKAYPIEDSPFYFIQLCHLL